MLKLHTLTRLIKKGIPFCLTLLLLPAVMWLFFNASVNRHFHITTEGIMIVHAHPFAKTDADQFPVPSHRHNSRELMLLSLFSEVVCSILILFLAGQLLAQVPLIMRFRRRQDEPPKQFYHVYLYHAPPGD
jgi:hypothetical protein